MRQRIKETGGQKWKARLREKRQANREELEGRRTWGSSKQREQPKKHREKKIDCVGELVVLKRSQTLRPSPQPHLCELQPLPLPSPASGPAINTFSIKSTGEQKGRGGGEEGGRRRTLKESEWIPWTTPLATRLRCAYSRGPIIVPRHTRAV